MEILDKEMKKKVKNSIGRLTFVGIAVLFQMGWIILRIVKLNSEYPWIASLTDLVAVALVLWIYIKQMNSTMKMLWIMLILVSPILGVCLYILFGRSDVTKGMRLRFEKIDTELADKTVQAPEVIERLEQQDFAIANQSRYILNYGKYPVYENTEVTYYPEAFMGIEAQKTAMKEAKKYIFMEYHAIEDRISFAEIHEILKKKAEEGVEVRILYDDVGSIGFINRDFVKRMEKYGIQCRIFNPVIPILDIFMNNRDHRKITIIDGKIGFTGGYNLADEYFNITQPYGYWKDTGLRLEGEAIGSLVVMFLQMWNSVKKTDVDYDQYLLPDYKAENAKGFVQPYADTPLDDELTGENVYLNIIKNAKKYVYFMTPYLIISDEMTRELVLAAKRGVDVRIITPGIPDKKTVYRITRSYYDALVLQGVRIYEYTPGFCHGKMCVADDEVAVVGTINLDYRSLYLHFENGVFLFDCPAVGSIRKDFDSTFAQSEDVTEKYRQRKSVLGRIGSSILRLVAPLL